MAAESRPLLKKAPNSTSASKWCVTASSRAERVCLAADATDRFPFVLDVSCKSAIVQYGCGDTLCEDPDSIKAKCPAGIEKTPERIVIGSATEPNRRKDSKASVESSGSISSLASRART